MTPQRNEKTDRSTPNLRCRGEDGCTTQDLPKKRKGKVSGGEKEERKMQK